ncbi:CRAL-TRIO domain-containing protein [Entophlyctis helioformis]|nr:CRAL-TRIO domain-containing protein [Entophlyctis helioformis]
MPVLSSLSSPSALLLDSLPSHSQSHSQSPSHLHPHPSPSTASTAMSQVGPSERDKQEVEKFRAAIVQAGIKLDPSRHDDRTLVRFLKARKYDPAKSLKMFAECEQWRQEFAVENVVQSFAYTESAAVDKVYPRFYHKTDREGRPVYIEVLATLDVKLLFAVTDQERVITRHVREYEKLMRYRLPACSARSGRPIDQGTTIIDLKGVPLSSFNQVRKIIQSLSAIAQNYYPRRWAACLLSMRPRCSRPSGPSSRACWMRTRSQRSRCWDRATRSSCLRWWTPRTCPSRWAASASVQAGATRQTLARGTTARWPGIPLRFGRISRNATAADPTGSELGL